MMLSGGQVRERARLALPLAGMLLFCLVSVGAAEDPTATDAMAAADAAEFRSHSILHLAEQLQAQREPGSAGENEGFPEGDAGEFVEAEPIVASAPLKAAGMEMGAETGDVALSPVVFGEVAESPFAEASAPIEEDDSVRVVAADEYEAAATIAEAVPSAKAPQGEQQEPAAAADGKRFVDAVRADRESGADQGPVILAQGGGTVPRGDVVVVPEEHVHHYEENPRLPDNTPAVSTFEREGGKAGIMRVLAGKSLIVDLESSAKRVSVANPEVAEVLIISPRQVMINGLGNGETSVIVWDRNGNYTMHTLVVGDQLQDQVMLEITVAEINRTAMEEHGVDVRSFGGQFGGISQYGSVAPLSGGASEPPKEGQPLFPVALDGGISWAVVDLKNNIGLFFKQLQQENLARVLAEPKLLARSGKEAKFLSGGEIPIVITQNDDTTIEFKEFGTKIEFVPEVREDGTIDLKVTSEVSEPDFAAGVELFGFKVPAFITRRVDTDVTLNNGQSLVIAGLIKETKQELESKMPFVGDIPLLGYFFRSTSYSKDLLELVIVVRPMLVAPIEAGVRVPLPTDRGPLSRDEVRTKAEREKVSRPRPY